MAELTSAGLKSARIDRVHVRRAIVLANTGSGAFSQMPAIDVEQWLADAFARHGVAADIRLVAGTELHQAALSARAEAEHGEVDAVVVGGGDGSIRAVAGVFAATDVPLGIVPLGTRNHFAKDLGLPLEIEDAAATIAAGRTRLVDLAEVNGAVFINNSSIGIYPYLVIDRERRRALHGLAKWTAMVPAFIRMFRHFPRRRLRIAAKDFARPYRTPCLFVGNNEYGMELFTFGRRHRLDAGRLWFYVVKPRTPLAFFWMVCRLCFGRIDQERDLDTFALAEATIDAKTSRLPVALDGEVEIMHTPLHYRVRPRALRVFASEAPRG
jgi:diacylglycerol kinase family enzyme